MTWLRPLRAASLLCALGLSSFGAEVGFSQGLTVTLEPPEITIEDHAVLSVTVQGAGGEKPTMPPLPDFESDYIGQSSRLEWINGRGSRQVTYRWQIIPRAVGEFTIGSVRVSIRGEVHESLPLPVRVLPAASRPSEPRGVFVAASVSNSRPYVGEQILYTWRFYYAVNVHQPRLEPLVFEPFLVEDLGEVRQYSTTYGGTQYKVSELRKALFAQQIGVHTLPSSRLDVAVVVPSGRRRNSSPFDDFFTRVQTETKALRTDPIEIDVQPLPAAPPDFSGLIGSFEVAMALSKTELEVGDSLTQKVTVQGSGNVQMFGESPLADPIGFKVYEDQPVGSIVRTGNELRGSKTWSRALVPLAAGSAVVPEVRLVYFDPSKDAFVAATAASVALDVLPGSFQEDLRLTESLAPSTGKVAVRILADDILPIYRGLEVVRPKRLAKLGGGVTLFLPPLMFSLIFSLRRREERFRADLGLRRSRGAQRTALRAIREAEREGDSAADYSRILKAYIGDKTEAEGRALTAGECAKRLRGRGVEDSLVAKVERSLLEAEIADYAGGAAPSSGLGSASAKKLLATLERQLRRSAQ